MRSKNIININNKKNKVVSHEWAWSYNEMPSLETIIKVLHFGLLRGDASTINISYLSPGKYCQFLNITFGIGTLIYYLDTIEKKVLIKIYYLEKVFNPIFLYKEFTNLIKLGEGEYTYGENR